MVVRHDGACAQESLCLPTPVVEMGTEQGGGGEGGGATALMSCLQAFWWQWVSQGVK